MLNHEMPGVAVVRAKVFPDAVGQFRLALAGHYFETVRVLFGLHPSLRNEFEDLLLRADLGTGKDGQTSRELAVNKKLQRLRELWSIETARDGLNNNKRWAKKQSL